MMGWVGMALTIAGLFLNARSNRWCWYVWLVSNGAWVTYGIQTKQASIILSQVVYFGFNVYGLVKWRNK